MDDGDAGDVFPSPDTSEGWQSEKEMMKGERRQETGESMFDYNKLMYANMMCDVYTTHDVWCMYYYGE